MCIKPNWRAIRYNNIIQTNYYIISITESTAIWNWRTGLVQKTAGSLVVNFLDLLIVYPWCYRASSTSYIVFKTLIQSCFMAVRHETWVLTKNEDKQLLVFKGKYSEQFETQKFRAQDREFI
jgi:hypothetical protein